MKRKTDIGPSAEKLFPSGISSKDDMFVLQRLDNKFWYVVDSHIMAGEKLQKDGSPVRIGFRYSASDRLAHNAPPSWAK